MQSSCETETKTKSKILQPAPPHSVLSKLVSLSKATFVVVLGVHQVHELQSESVLKPRVWCRLNKYSVFNLPPQSCLLSFGCSGALDRLWGVGHPEGAL